MSRRRQKETIPFSKVLISLMSERKLSLREAARISGVSPSTISDWRNGRSPDNFMAVKKLAQALGTTLGFLLTGEYDSREPGMPITVTEAFEPKEIIFEGIARVFIQKLSPREISEEKPSENAGEFERHANLPVAAKGEPEG